MLTDDRSCAKDVEGAKLAFFKKFNSIYHSFSFVDKNVLLHFFRLHAMSFYGAETWYIKLNKKYLKNISVPCQGGCIVFQEGILAPKHATEIFLRSFVLRFIYQVSAP